MKRFISIILCMVMITTLLPVAALAESQEPEAVDFPEALGEEPVTTPLDVIEEPQADDAAQECEEGCMLPAGHEGECEFAPIDTGETDIPETDTEGTDTADALPALLAAGGEVVWNEDYTLDADMSIPANAVLTMRGRLTIPAGFTLENNGALLLSGAMDVYGTLVNSENATITLQPDEAAIAGEAYVLRLFAAQEFADMQPGTLYNTGTIRLFGEAVIEQTAVFAAEEQPLVICEGGSVTGSENWVADDTAQIDETLAQASEGTTAAGIAFDMLEARLQGEISPFATQPEEETAQLPQAPIGQSVVSPERLHAGPVSSEGSEGGNSIALPGAQLAVYDMAGNIIAITDAASELLAQQDVDGAYYITSAALHCVSNIPAGVYALRLIYAADEANATNLGYILFTDGSLAETDWQITADNAAATVTVTLPGAEGEAGGAVSSACGDALVESIIEMEALLGENSGALLNIVLSSGTSVELTQHFLQRLIDETVAQIQAVLPFGSLRLDRDAMAHIRSLLSGEGEATFALRIAPADEAALNENQDALLEGAAKTDVQIICNGVCMETIGAGQADVALPYTAANGETPQLVLLNEQLYDELEQYSYNEADHSMGFVTASLGTFAVVDAAQIERAGNEELSLTLDQTYILVKKGDTGNIGVHVTPLTQTIVWEVIKPDGTPSSILTVNGAGAYNAVECGTAYAVATVTRGDETIEQRCRFDIIDTDLADLECTAMLKSNQAAVELNKTDYTKIPLVLLLKQNLMSSTATGTGGDGSPFGAAQFDGAGTPADTGVALTDATFVDSSTSAIFDLRVCDDKTLEIVPTPYAIGNPTSVKASYKSAISLTLGNGAKTVETTGQLTMTVKKTLPRITCAAVKFNSFFTEQVQPLVLTGGTVTKIEVDSPKATATVPAIPDWLELHESPVGTFNVKLKAGMPVTPSASGKLNLLATVEGWAVKAVVSTTASAARTVPALKLMPKAAVVLQSDYAKSGGVPLTLMPTNAKITLSELGVTDLLALSRYSIENFDATSGTFTLMPTGTPIPGEKITLQAVIDGTTETVPLAVSVTVQNVTLKPGKTSVTLSGTHADSAIVPILATPADYQLADPIIYVKNAAGATTNQLDATFDNASGTVCIKNNEYTQSGAAGTYKVEVRHAANQTPAVITVKVVSPVPTVTLTATGSIDRAFPDGAGVVLKPVYKNFNGEGNFTKSVTISAKDGTATVAGDQTGKFDITENTNGTYVIRVKTPDALVDTRKYFATFSVQPNGIDGSTSTTSIESAPVALTIKRTAVTIKLSPASIKLNKGVDDSVQVAVSYLPANFAMGTPMWRVTDSTGKTPCDGQLDISYANGILTVANNGSTETGTAYKVHVRAGTEYNESVLTVTPTISPISATLTATGTIDVIRPSSQIKLTPKAVNYSGAYTPEWQIIQYSGVNVIGDVTDRFNIADNGDGTYTLAKKAGAVIDPNCQYKITVSPEIGSSTFTASKPVVLNVKMLAAKVQSSAAKITLFTVDRFSTETIQLSSTDTTLDEMDRVVISNPVQADMFDVTPVGSGRYMIGYNDNEVTTAITQNIQLKVFYKGNSTAKENAIVALSVQNGSATSGIKIMQGSTDITGTTIKQDMSAIPTLSVSSVTLPYEAKDDVTWTTNSAKIATVTDQGVVSLHYPGTVTITATTKDGSKKTASFKITCYFRDEAARFTTGTDPVIPKIGLQQGHTTQMLVYGTDKTITNPLPADLFTYSIPAAQSSIATVDPDTGVITGGIKPGTATVTATMNDIGGIPDPLKRKATLTVKVIAAQAADILLMPESKTGVDIEYLDEFGNVTTDLNLIKSCRVTVDKRDVDNTVGAFQFKIHPAVNDSNGTQIEPALTYTTTDGGVATVVENKEENNATITIAKDTSGACTVSGIAKDLQKAAGYLYIFVRDTTPRIETNNITLNPMQDAGTSITLLANYGNDINTNLDSVKFQEPNAAGIYVDSTRIIAMYNNATDKLTIKVKANTTIEDCVINGSLIIACRDGAPYTLPMTVTVRSSLPEIAITQKKAFNLFYRDSKAECTFTAKGADISDVMFETDTFRAIHKGDGKIEVEYTDVPMFTDANMPYADGIAHVYVTGYRNPIEVPFMLSTVTTKPVLELSSASSVINTTLLNRETSFTVKEKVSGAVMDLEHGDVYWTRTPPNAMSLTLDAATDILTLSLDPVSGVYKGGTATIRVQDSNWMQPIVMTHKVAVTNKTPVPKLAATVLTLNKKASLQAVKTKLTTDQANQPFPKVKIDLKTGAAAEANKIEVVYDDSNGEITANFIDGRNLPAAGTYAYQLTITLDSGTTLTTKPTLSVKVVDINPSVTVTVSGKLDTMDTGSTLIYTPKLANVSGEIETVTLEGTDAARFDAVLDRNDKGQQIVKLAMADGGNAYSTAATYKVKLSFTVTDVVQPVKTVDLSVKVTQTAIKLAVVPTPGIAFQTQDDFVLPFTLKLSSPEKAQLEAAGITLNTTATNALLQQAMRFEVVDVPSGGRSAAVRVTLKNTSRLKAGATYSVVLDVKPKNNASNLVKPIQVKLSFILYR